MSRSLCILAIIACLAPAMVDAQTQESSRVGVGSVIRITPYNGRRITGAISEMTPDSVMIFKRDRKQTETHVARADIQRMQINAGKSRAAGAMVKGGVGLFAGVLVGSLVGYLSYEEPPPPQNLGEVLVRCLFGCSRGANAAIGAFTLGTIGLVAGTIYGSITGADSWVDVPRR